MGPQEKHSGIGIASFIAGIVSGMAMFLLIVIAGIIEESSPGGIDEESPIAIVVGLFLFLFLFVALVGVGLGIGGLIQNDRQKLFAVLGTIFSACTFLGTLLLVLIGLAME